MNGDEDERGERLLNESQLPHSDKCLHYDVKTNCATSLTAQLVMSALSLIAFIVLKLSDFDKHFGSDSDAGGAGNSTSPEEPGDGSSAGSGRLCGSPMECMMAAWFFHLILCPFHVLNMLHTPKQLIINMDSLELSLRLPLFTYTVPLTAIISVMPADAVSDPSLLCVPLTRPIGRICGSMTALGPMATPVGVYVRTDEAYRDIVFSPAIGPLTFIADYQRRVPQGLSTRGVWSRGGH
mmetsp:Transcript_65954/g.157709  ORF Transcript_65954/g.157709 Transcript_65954/m.157709 type:complete len:238 (+) Transcript_65954:131-844(+)